METERGNERRGCQHETRAVQVSFLRIGFRKGPAKLPLLINTKFMVLFISENFSQSERPCTACVASLRTELLF